MTARPSHRTVVRPETAQRAVDRVRASAATKEQPATAASAQSLLRTDSGYIGGADLVAAFVRLGKRSSPGSAPRSWPLCTKLRRLVGARLVTAFSAERQPARRGRGPLLVVRTSSALGVDLDFASTNPGLAGSLPFGRAGPSRGSASARGLRRRLVSVAFGLEHCRVGNTK